VSAETEPNDDAILADMLRQSERLCQSADALLVGQYRHLQDRIRALIELRECARMVKGE
jgi:hypothetical protein